MSDAEVIETVNAPASAVYQLVSDLPRMGEFSPENTGGQWLDGASGPAVGARFRGTNRMGWRRWSTTVTVTAADPGARFAFDVSSGPVPVATWEYELTESGGSTQITERFTDRRPGWMKLLAGPLTGVSDRQSHNRDGMRRTLAAVKAAAESRS